MGTRAAVIAAIAATAAGAAACDGDGAEQPRRMAPVAGRPAPAPAAHERRGAVTADCSMRSEATFSLTRSRDLVVGPLALVGGAYTDAATVREFGGNKFPLLVKVGHSVTVRIGQGARRTARLAYGPLPQGEVKLSDAHRAVTFVACAAGRRTHGYSPDGPSGSEADGEPVTFWSGFVLVRSPACVPLEVHVDDERAPRRVALALGRRCAT